MSNHEADEEKLLDHLPDGELESEPWILREGDDETISEK